MSIYLYILAYFIKDDWQEFRVEFLLAFTTENECCLVIVQISDVVTQIQSSDLDTLFLSIYVCVCVCVCVCGYIDISAYIGLSHQ